MYVCVATAKCANILFMIKHSVPDLFVDHSTAFIFIIKFYFFVIPGVISAIYKLLMALAW